MATPIISHCLTCKKQVITPASRAKTFKTCSQECRKVYLSNKNKEISPKRFWARVNKKHSDECWEWMGCKNKSGYGSARHNGVVSRAHRIAYKLHYGDITSGMYIMHLCDNRGCCNPKHLREGTQKENVLDCVNKGRMKGQVLNQKLVDKIRYMYLHEGIKQIDISRITGIKKATISSAITGKTWGRINVPSDKELKSSFRLIRKSTVNIGRAKLNFSIASKIRGEYKSGTISQHTLAKKYNVSPMSINRIINLLTWKYDYGKC